MNQQSARRSYSRLPRERRERDILEAARAEFCRVGYDDTVVATIAEAAGVVEGTVYKYFENKRELLVRVIEQWYAGMLAAYEEGLQGVTGVRNRLRYVIWRHLYTIRTEPDLCRLVFQELRRGKEYRESTVADWNRQYIGVAVDVVEEGIAIGELRSDVSLRLVRDLIYGSMEHSTWSYLNSGIEFDPADTADQLTDLIYRSIVAKPEPSSPAEADRLSTVAARLEQVADRLEGKKG